MKRTAGNRNRRQTRSASNQHLLDVRVRRSTAKRQRRHRVLSTSFSVVLWVALAVGTCFGFHAIVNHFFLQNPEYNLRIVDVDLDDLMSRDEALRLSGITPGTNIFRIDLSAAERAFRQIDQIDTVTIQRDWPDKITLKLTKRIPVAWLAQAGAEETGRSLLIDTQGRTMKPYRIEPEYWHLPVILVSDPTLIEKKDPLTIADLQAALDLLEARAGQADSLLDIRSIDITKGFALDIVDADKVLVTFSPQDPAGQLKRLQKLLLNCQETGRKLESVNLIPKKYTPVRFLLASTQETDSTEVSKPERAR
jgi:cell division protein FtsQ